MDELMILLVYSLLILSPLVAAAWVADKLEARE